MKGKELKDSKVEVVLKDEKTYCLEYTLNALIEMEEIFGDFTKISEAFQNFRLKNLRTLLWAGLIEHHSLSEKEVGSLIDMKNVESITTSMMKAFEASFPVDETKGEATEGSEDDKKK